MKNKKLIPFFLASFLLGSSLVSCKKDSVPSSSSSEKASSSSREPKKDLSGQGEPSDAIGNDGDSYTDLSNGDIFTKVKGHWVKTMDAKKNYSGIGAPATTLGKDGDTYTDTSTGDIYTRQGGVWIKTTEGDLGEHYNVSFDLNGGHLPDGSSTLPVQKVKRGEWVSEPNVLPVKANSTFLGWFSGNSDTAWVFTNPVYGEMFLKAHYSVDESKKVTLSFDPANGSPVKTVDTFDGDYLTLDIPTKDGYEFTGWYLEGETDPFNGIVTADMAGKTFTAHYKKAKFNVLFSLDNTTGEATITGLRDKTATSIDIPESIEGHLVTAIGEKAFQNDTRLVSINLPKGIKTISRKAFLGSRLLKTITVNSGNVSFFSKDGILYDKGQTELVLCPAKNLTSYTCPSSLKKIGDYAFFGHKDAGINAISLNEGLTEIGDYAFGDNEAMTSISFPSSLKKIGNSAFGQYSEGVLQTIQFNDGLEEIGDSAFTGAYLKDAFAFPSSVKKIGDYAFANCTAITKVTFPKSLETLGYNVFSGATGILSIDLEKGNTNFALDDGILYTADKKKALFCPSGRTDPVVIPEGTEEIGDGCFYMVDECQSYSFPSSLKKIGKQAFAYCYGLKSFAIPSSVLSIGEECFDKDEKLASITIGTGLTSIPAFAFSGCVALTSISIPGNVKEIGQSAFAEDILLSGITFSEGLEKIGAYAFYFVDVKEDDDQTEMASPVLASVSLPNSLQSIGSSAFRDQSALASVSFGSSLSLIEPNAFANCPLTDMTLSASNTSMAIDDKVLYSSDRKKAFFASPAISGALSLPSTLEEVEPYAFYNCKKITSLTLPSTLKDIGEGAFYNLFTGSSVPGSLVLDSGLKTIGEGAFAFANISSLTLNDGLADIGGNAFTYTDISSVSIPDSVSAIGSQAFCASSKLVSVSFGSGLKRLGDDAFFNCPKLSGTVSFGKDLASFGCGVFSGSKLSGLTIDAGNTVLKSVDGMVLDKAGTTVKGVVTDKTSLSVPEGVVEIGKEGLSAATTLTSLTLPSTLNILGEEAFMNTCNLSSLVIPAAVECVGPKVFNYFTSSQKVTFSCKEEYALMHFDPLFDSGCNGTISYTED
jgi:uncharacterized repeat protein (TIGR02543 family)